MTSIAGYLETTRTRVYETLARWEVEGLPGLADRSRAPHHHARKVDLTALGAMRAALESGRRVPEDIAIVGIDDIDDGRYATPSLTTIAPDKQALARVAVELLIGRIEGSRTAPPEVHTVPFALAVRESTAGRRLDR